MVQISFYNLKFFQWLLHWYGNENDLTKQPITYTCLVEYLLILFEDSSNMSYPCLVMLRFNFFFLNDIFYNFRRGSSTWNSNPTVSLKFSFIFLLNQSHLILRSYVLLSFNILLFSRKFLKFSKMASKK